MNDIKLESTERRLAASGAPVTAEPMQHVNASSLKRKPQDQDSDGSAAAETPVATTTIETSHAVETVGDAVSASEADVPVPEGTGSASTQGSSHHLAIGGGLGLLGLIGTAAGGGHSSPTVQPVQQHLDPIVAPPAVSTPVVTPPQHPDPTVSEDPKAHVPDPAAPHVDVPPTGTTTPPTTPDSTPPNVTPPDHGSADTKPTEPDHPVVPTAPVLDTTPPAHPTLSLKHDTGADSTDGITSDSTIKVEGLEQDATWRYRIDGDKTWHAGRGAELAARMPDGVHDVQVVQTDKAGNDSEAATLNFKLDTGAPTLELKNDTGRGHYEFADGKGVVFVIDPGLSSDRITSDGTLTVKGLPDGAKWTYSVDGGQNWFDGSTSEIAASALGADGMKTVQVMRVGADEHGAYSEFSFTLDTHAPMPLEFRLKNDDGFDPGDRISSDPTLLLGGLEQGAAVRGLPESQASSEFVVSGSEGVVELRDCTQTDIAGNESQPSSFNFVLTSASDKPQLDSGSFRFGTAGADTFKMKESAWNTDFFNYNRAEGDVIDLSAIAATKNDVVRNLGDSVLVYPSDGSGWDHIFLSFENVVANSPIRVMTGDGQVFDV